MATGNSPTGLYKRLAKAAIIFRKQEEEFLMQTDANRINREDLYFFYPVEESEEFE